ncbi:hypothetical protein [Sedimentisphaera cyanobacteriorum]|nr:hypothetical protein [Sedimentisphaera cyanobacteriorum]
MSNMKGAVTAVTAYHADNYDYPPHPTSGARPNLLARTKANQDTILYNYLKGYVDDVTLFNCPVSGFDKTTVAITQGGDTYTYQEAYTNKDNVLSDNSIDLNCSYALYWNFKSYYQNSRNVASFMGPGKKSKGRNKLLISDYMGYYDQLRPNQSWVCSHKFSGSAVGRSSNDAGVEDPPYHVLKDANPSDNIEQDRDGFTVPSGDLFGKTELNCGYIDGSLLKCKGTDTIQMIAAGAQWSWQFMPDKDHWK